MQYNSRRIRHIAAVLSTACSFVACATEKSRNPLSPSIAGPIEGVVISSPVSLKPTDGQLVRIDDEWWFQDDWNRGHRSAEWLYKNTENPIRYHSEWMMRSREQDYDYAPIIQLFKLATQRNYTEEEINRVVDNIEITKHSAIRGYIGDWDSFTLGRGKNSFMYRRSTDGKFQFMHWDSDLAFSNTNESFILSLIHI